MRSIGASVRRANTRPAMIDSELTQQVRKAIARLPDHFRAALVLCEYENLSYVEIAEALGASVPQVKTWIHRARRQLAGMLKDYVKVFAGAPEQQAAEDLSTRVVHIAEFVARAKDKPAAAASARRRVTYHSSCHLRAAGVTQETCATPDRGGAT